MPQLTSNTHITRTLAANVGTAAGSSAVDGLAGASVDMSGFEGCYFIQHVVMGGTGGAVSFAVRASTAAVTALSSAGQGSALASSTSTISAGSSATAETFVVEVYRPRNASGQRHIFGQVSVASSCSILGPQFAIRYEAYNANAGSTGDRTLPQSTGSANGITGGVVRSVSPA